MFAGRDSDDSDGSGPSERRWRRWLLLDGHRGVVAGVTAVAIFAFAAAISTSGLTPLRNLQPLYYVFSGLITGNLTIITVVVSIGQLLLSQELNTPNELRSEMESVIDYRDDVEDAAGRIAPVEPLGFLRLLFENTREEAQKLGGLTISESDEEVYDEVDQVVSEVTDRADRVDALLQDSDASTFRVLSTTLTTNYARDINHLRRIKFEYGDRLSAPANESIDDLVDDLRNIDVARQYFKTVYLQEELAWLSRVLFYTGLPSVVIVVGGLFALTESGGASVPPPYLSLAVPAITAVGLLPITVLFAFILRITTVTQRTAATTPFTTPKQEK